MTHVLVIGGTGMLANTSLWFVRKGYHVSVIGRNPNRMESLKSKAIDKSLITPVLVDYSDEALLKEKLRNTLEENGPITLVIAWIHSYAKNALEVVLREISNRSDGMWRIFHILGSGKNLGEIKGRISVPDSAQYYQVQLGFIIENGHSRWLTNDEISQGVIDSIQNDKFINTIGTIIPWDKRPS